MADRRGIVVPLLILAFIFLSPDPVRPPRSQFDPRPTIHDVIAEEERSLAVLQNSTYTSDRLANPNTAPLNLTGFEPERGYSWGALPLVQSKTWGWLQYTAGLGDGGEDSVWRALNFATKDAPLYKNVTGFVHGKWARSTLDPDHVSSPKLNLSDYAPDNPFGGPKLVRPFERNITGDGGDIRVRFHERQAPVSEPLEIEYINATQMSVEMTITDAVTAAEYELRVFGVYFPTAGQAVLTTTSDKFAGIFALPHLALSGPMFEESRRVLNESILRNIHRQISGETERYNPWPSTLEGVGENPFALPTCELIVYLQQLAPVTVLPTPSSTSTLLSLLERELRFPTGALLPQPPALHFAMSAFSPDCGFAIESVGPPDHAPQEGNHLTGPKLEVLYISSRHHILAFTLVLALQLALLVRQMREASTPSTRSRLSFYTIAMLSLGDGFTTMTFMLASLFVGGLWVNLVGTAFLAFISVSFFGMRFLMDIWIVQAPEREQVRREEAEEERRREERFQAALQRIRAEQTERAVSTGGGGGETPAAGGDANNGDGQPPAPNDTPAEQPRNPVTSTIQRSDELQAGTLPLPVTAQRPTDTGATPMVFMPSDQAGLLPTTQPNIMPQPTTLQIAPPRESFGALYTRFYLLLLLTLFVSLNAASWPAGARRLFFTALALAYLSFWLPQIKRNVKRNCRHALNWEFVVGQSVLRLLPFVYFYGYGGNVLFAEVDYTSLAILAVWVWAQVVLLASQELVGPRWFVGKGWAPEAWDYHPVLREDEEGLMMPIGLSSPQSTDEDGRVVEGAPASPVSDRKASIDATTTTTSTPAADGSTAPATPSRRRSSLAAKEARERAGEKGKRTFDCAICMQTLEVSIVEADGSTAADMAGPAGLLARRAYMVTPCRHIFHSGCLEGWMKYRLQCPICREGLPAL